MMFDFAWSEMALIAAVALIVIGPKDLPKVLRTVGVWVGKARAVAREFQSSVDQMVREAELDEVRRTIEKATDVQHMEREIEKTVDPKGELKEALTPPVLPSLEPPEPLPAVMAPTTPVPAAEAPATVPLAATETGAVPVPDPPPSPPPVERETAATPAHESTPAEKTGTHS
jgi:sec-independent protein translocase protein TatB